MKTQQFILVFLIVCMVISCGKSKVDNPIEDPIENPGDKPDPVAHGTPIGDAVQKTIGTEGGTIQMPDNEISVNIPAGALAVETTISIQEVSSTLGNNGLGKSYRLLPENVQFKQDVEITFAYNDTMLIGKFEDLLFMAYQDAQGYWRVPKNNVLDKTNRTLKVKTRHFSDWSGYGSAYISADKNELSSGEETTLRGSYYFITKDAEDLSVDDLLSTNYDAGKEHVEEWKVVSGLGELTPKEDGTATFKAPANITDFSTSKIQLKFKNILNPRTGTEGLVLAYADIQLVPDEYIAWDFGGKRRQSATPVATYYVSSLGERYLTITANDDGAKVPINIRFNVYDENTYKFASWGGSGTVSVGTLDGGPFGVHSGCPNGQMIGYVDLQSVDWEQRNIQGTIFGTLIESSGVICNNDKPRQPISGRFRMKFSVR